MTTHRITLSGCDDTTHIDVDLTDGEAALVARLAALSEEESAYSCQPVMGIRRSIDDDD